jgi:hypothetical protein
MNPHGCLAQKSRLVILPLFGVTPPTIHARWLPLLKVEILLNGKKNDQPKF